MRMSIRHHHRRDLRGPPLSVVRGPALWVLDAFFAELLFAELAAPFFEELFFAAPFFEELFFADPDFFATIITPPNERSDAHNQFPTLHPRR